MSPVRYSVTPDGRRVDCLSCDVMIANQDSPLTPEQVESAKEWHADDCHEESPQQVTYQEAILEGADPYEPDDF